MPGGTWTENALDTTNIAFVTADPIPSDTAYDETSLYALSTSGSVLAWEVTFGEYTLTDSACSGGTISFVQIAAKNYTVYGLDSSGSVWFLTPETGTCWTEITEKTGFVVSIATDNGDFNGVWASDTSGNIWTAD